MYLAWYNNLVTSMLMKPRGGTCKKCRPWNGDIFKLLENKNNKVQNNPRLRASSLKLLQISWQISGSQQPIMYKAKHYHLEVQANPKKWHKKNDAILLSMG